MGVFSGTAMISISSVYTIIRIHHGRLCAAMMPVQPAHDRSFCTKDPRLKDGGIFASDGSETKPVSKVVRNAALIAQVFRIIGIHAFQQLAREIVKSSMFLLGFLRLFDLRNH